jgi:MSHA biogenesis protein MshJ
MSSTIIGARLSAWLARRALRERVLAAVAVLVVLGLVFDSYVAAPQRAKEAALRRQIAEQDKAMLVLQARAQEQTAHDDQLARERSAALATRRAHAEQVIRDAQVDLIAPQDMGRQLQALLARHPELRLLAMTTLAPTPLGEGQGQGQSKGNDTKAAVQAAPLPVAGKDAPARAVASGLYQHGVEVTVEGRYLDVLSWLRALEKAPYRIYWRELDMQVNADGMPVTRIALFTLSREAVWMRL